MALFVRKTFSQRHDMYEHDDRNMDGERDLCRHMLIIAIRDAVSDSGNKVVMEKNRKNAIRWLTSKDESSFSFNCVIEYLFGDVVDVDEFRGRILTIIKKHKISGVKNLNKIFET